MDWRAFVQRHLHAPIRLNQSRSEYHALSKQVQSRIKRVGYFTPGAFREPTRQQHLVDHCNLICLDVDNSAEAAPLASSAVMLTEQLSPFNYVAYHTASSTPDLPRIRIVVDAEHIPPGCYAAAVNTIAARVGIAQANTESILVHQPMFCPTVFADSTEHPVFASRMDGRAFTQEDIAETTTEGKVTLKPTAAADPSLDDLAFLRAPLEGFTLDMAKDALAVVSSSCDYWDWLHIGWALHHQFLGSAEAYDLFDEWSRRGNNYVSPDDTEAKWASMKVHPSGKAPVTIRTLIKRAAATGKWSHTETVKAATFAAMEAWLYSATEHDLEVVAAKRIAALPLASHAQIAKLVATIIRTAKSKYEIPLKESALHKDIRKAKALLNPYTVPKEDHWPEVFRGVCYVTRLHKFYHVLKQEAYSPDAFDTAFGRHLLPTEEQIANAENVLDPSKPLMRPRDYVANKLQCTVAYDFTYDPSQPNLPIIEEDGRVFVNTYSDSGYPRPTEEGAEAAGEVILDHLYRLVKEAAYRRHIMDWLAFIVQHPGVKIRHALAIQGVKGCGKTVLANLLATLLGSRHLAVVDNDTISRGWSEWACGSQVVAIEEIKVAGHNRHETMNRLKPFIANDVIPINERGTATRTTRNRTNYILFTNFHDALVVTDDERRYFVIESRMQTREQKMQWIPEGHFNRLFDVIQNQGSALRYFFENWQISSDFDPNADAPRTVYLDNLIHDCANEETATVRRVIEQGGDPLIMTDLVGVENLRRRLQAEDLRLSMHRIGKVLRDEGYARVDKLIQVDGLRQCFYRKQGMLNGTTDIAEVVRQRAKLPIEGVFQ